VAYLGDYFERNSRLLRIYPGFNFQLERYGPQPLRVQLNGGYGQFADQYDQPLPTTNQTGLPVTFVQTTFLYGDLRLIWRPWPTASVQPYASLGAGLIFFRPTDRDGRPLIDRNASRPGEEDYNAIIPQLPVSLGARMAIAPQLSAGVGYTFRFVPSDYLDNLGVAGPRAGFDATHHLTLFMTFQLGIEE